VGPGGVAGAAEPKAGGERGSSGEVLALRSILINLLFSVSQGKPVTAEAMAELIARRMGTNRSGRWSA